MKGIEACSFDDCKFTIRYPDDVKEACVIEHFMERWRWFV